MSTIEINQSSNALESVYDRGAFSQSDFEAELANVEQATEIERQWISHSGLKPYESDDEILQEAAAGRLARVASGVGYITRQYLRDWSPDRSNPRHQFHYSPPFVLPEAKEFIEDISREWQSEMGASRSLSITSLVRSEPYQRNLGQQDRKLTIVKEDQVSSHQVGLAFDIDGCGIVEQQDNGEMRSINPRSPHYSHRLVSESRLVLQSLLKQNLSEERINFVEELPGTQQHCFHVSMNPLKF